jgi:hypothetical protein
MNLGSIENTIANAIAEIHMLRRDNEILRAQVDVVNTFKAALLGPPPAQGMGIDVVHNLRQAADEIRDERLKPTAPEAEIDI